MTQEPKLKIIIAKPGLDGHDRGAKVVAEVVYTGIRQTPEMIAETALQEDANLIGLSILSGAHLELFPRVVAELKKRKMDDVVLFAGGIIPKDDIEQLEKLGFKGVFGPGSSTLDIIEWVKKNAGEPAAA
jgi:methylmalonyl-CoA mutase C-terminal domain/subunit